MGKGWRLERVITSTGYYVARHLFSQLALRVENRDADKHALTHEKSENNTIAFGAKNPQ